MQKITKLWIVSRLWIASGIALIIISNIKYTAIMMIVMLSNTINSSQELPQKAWELIFAMTSIVGALMIGMGILINQLENKKYIIQNAEKSVIIAISVWFLVDTVVSFVYGFAYNVIPNILFYGFILLIMLFYPTRGKSTEEDLGVSK